MRTFLFFLLFVCAHLGALAQEQSEVKCTATLSKTEVLAGHTVQITFTAENLQNAQFTPPKWPDGVTVAYGPSQSSQVQVINGVVTSKQSWTYGLRVKEVGQVHIAEAIFAEGDTKHTTTAQTITVKPNPDGVAEEPERPAARQRYDIWGNPVPPAQPAQPAKPKRPTVRL